MPRAFRHTRGSFRATARNLRVTLTQTTKLHRLPVMSAFDPRRTLSRPNIRGRMRSLLLVGLLLISGLAAASPCDSVRRDLSESQRTEWAEAIARQLNVPRVTVLQAFELKDWKIVYVNTPSSDPPFIFFHGAPDKVHYVGLWSGGARADEEAGIRDWAIKNVPGIPSDLAECFAFHVTRARDLEVWAKVLFRPIADITQAGRQSRIKIRSACTF